MPRDGTDPGFPAPGFESLQRRMPVPGLWNRRWARRSLLGPMSTFFVEDPALGNVTPGMAYPCSRSSGAEWSLR
jgi:hypothetical protein